MRYKVREPRYCLKAAGGILVIHFRFCIALAAGLTLAGGSGPAAAQSLPGELSVLLDTHPQLQAKRKAVSSAEDAIGAARSGFMPTVRVTGDAGGEYVDSPDRRMAFGKPFDRSREQGGVTVTQHVFDGFATDSAVDAATVTRTIAEVDLKNTRQATLLEGISAYILVLRASRLIQLARESERNVQEQLKLEDERVQKGAGITSDVLAAKQRLQVAKESRVRFEGEFHASVAKYTQVFGHPPSVSDMIEPPVPADKLPPTLNEALGLAEGNNPQIETAARSIELADERRRAAEAGYFPTLDVVAKGNYGNAINAETGMRRDGSLLLTANWELFSGWKTDSLVSQAAHDKAASQDNHLHATRKVQELVRTTWYKLSTARERLGLLDNAANLAEEVWKAMQARHDAGKATIHDVLDDETKIFDARINYAQAYYDMVTATFELLAADGMLEFEVLDDPNPHVGTFPPPDRIGSRAGS